MSGRPAPTWATGSAAIGAVLPEWTLPPVEREKIAEFVQATNDPNPVHVDREYANRSGFPDVIASGGMTQAWVGQFLMRLVGVRHVRQMSVQLRTPVFPGDVVTCTGTVSARVDDRLSCDLVATKQDGSVVAHGTAVLLVAEEPSAGSAGS